MEEKDGFDLPEGVTAKKLQISAFEQKQTGFTSGFYHLQPYNQVHAKAMLNLVKSIKDFECRHDDVWIGSFPKSGKNTET